MSAIIPESELRRRETEILAKLNESPTHDIGIALEAMALGFTMGEQGVETALLKDKTALENIEREMTLGIYPTLKRLALANSLTRRLNSVFEKPSLELTPQVIRELTLASAILGNLHGRTKLG